MTTHLIAGQLAAEHLTGLDAADVRRLLRLSNAKPEGGVIVDADPAVTAPTDTPNPVRNPS